MTNSSSRYWNDNYLQYKNEDNPGGVFLLSFVQNMLSSIVSITNIYISMTNNIELGDMYAVQYDIARLLRVLTVFPKIE